MATGTLGTVATTSLTSINGWNAQTPVADIAAIAEIVGAALRDLARRQAGDLLQHRAADAGQDADGPAVAMQLRQLMGQQMGQLGWHQSLRQAGLALRTHDLLPWSRWITPRQPAVTNKRFDTRFFVARVSDDQVASHDNFETTDSVWLTPLQALTRYAQGQIDLVAPQIMSLYELKAHDTVDAALSEARQRAPALIEPHPFDQDGQRILCYPGDERHPVAQRALRGPTRLLFTQGRFVPLGGMAQLLD